jgi:hypothetical protein
MCIDGHASGERRLAETGGRLRRRSNWLSRDLDEIHEYASLETQMRASHKITAAAGAIVLGLVVSVAAGAFIIRRVDSARPVAPGAAVAPVSVAPGDTTPGIDSVAVRALERMGAYLRTLQAFQLRANVVTEEVRLDGQKVQIIREVTLVAKRPNKLHAEVTNAQQRRLFFYDGKSFTLWAPRLKYYSTVAAPASIAELADHLEATYDLELPLVDLFRWGTPAANVKAITSAIDAGPAEIDGTSCQHYLVRQDGIDWQVWLQLGDHPLPRRVVITTRTDEARPQHATTYTWNLAPSFNDGTFAFEAPEGAKKIPIATAVASR